MLSRYKKKVHPRIASALSDQFSPKEMVALSKLGTIVDFSEGRTLFTQGTPSLETMLVLEGQVDIQRDDRAIAQSSTGEFVGEIGVLRNEARSATAIAASNISVLIMSSREFESLLFLMPSIKASVSQEADSRVAEVIDLRSSPEPTIPSTPLVGAA